MATIGALSNSVPVVETSVETEIHELHKMQVYRLQPFTPASYRLAIGQGVPAELYQRLCRKRHSPGNPSVR